MAPTSPPPPSLSDVAGAADSKGRGPERERERGEKWTRRTCRAPPAARSARREAARRRRRFRLGRSAMPRAGERRGSTCRTCRCRDCGIYGIGAVTAVGRRRRRPAVAPALRSCTCTAQLHRNCARGRRRGPRRAPRASRARPAGAPANPGRGGTVRQFRAPGEPATPAPTRNAVRVGRTWCGVRLAAGLRAGIMPGPPPGHHWQSRCIWPRPRRRTSS